MAAVSTIPIKSHGILLVGHGTRNQQGHQEFLRLAALVAELASPTPVRSCLLELQRPNLADGWDEIVACGVNHVRIVPVLLWAAGHALRDLPSSFAELAKRTPGVTFEQTEVLAFHPLVLARSQQILSKMIARLSDFDCQRAALVSVGRGSTDNQATEDMKRFADIRGQASGLAMSEVGFVAMALPSLGSVLDLVGGEPSVRDVIVQPHLLFAGDLQCTVCKMVRRAALRYPAKRWSITEVLGPDESIARALIEVESSFKLEHPLVSSH